MAGDISAVTRKDAKRGISSRGVGIMDQNDVKLNILEESRYVEPIGFDIRGAEIKYSRTKAGRF